MTLLHYNILWDVKNVYSDSDRLLFVEMLNVQLFAPYLIHGCPSGIQKNTEISEADRERG